MNEYRIEASIRRISHEMFMHRNGLDMLVEDVECLTPYLSKDRESFCCSEKRFHMMEYTGSHNRVHSGSITCVVECDPIDEEDLLILLDMIAHKHTNTHSIEKITKEVQ